MPGGPPPDRGTVRTIIARRSHERTPPQRRAYASGMDRLLQDFRFGVRLLWRDRAFATTALLTLALCIGINAAIFAVVNSVLLQPLPIPQPDRLAVFYNSYPRAGIERSSNGVPDYYDRLNQVPAFDELAVYNTQGV